MKKLGQKVQGGYLTWNKKAKDGEEERGDEVIAGGSEDGEVVKRNGIIEPVNYLNGCV